MAQRVEGLSAGSGVVLDILLAGFAWMVAFVSLALVGRVPFYFIGQDVRPAVPMTTVFSSFWSGLALFVILLQAWSLLAPVDVFAQWAWWAVVIGALWLYLHRVRPKNFGVLYTYVRSARFFIFMILAILVVYVALVTPLRLSINAYDTLLYHWTWVTWTNQFPAVPGLANLHIRLGTNSAWLLIAAWVDNGWFDRQSAWILPGFPVTMVTLHLLHTIVLDRNASARVRWFAILVFPYVIRQLMALSPGLYFDAPALLMLVVFMVELMKWADRLGLREGSLWNTSAREVLVLLAPLLLSFVFKPIGALWVLLALSGSVLWLMKHARAGQEPLTRRIAALFPWLLMLGWMGRNMLLSGWLFFPAPIGKLPVDWVVPETTSRTDHAHMIQTVQGQSQIIQAWARRPGPQYNEAMNTPLSRWLPEWLRRNGGALEVRWLFPLSFLMTLLLLFHLARHRTTPNLFAALFLMFSLGQILFWFQMAPDLRFGVALFWMYFAAAGSLWLNQRNGETWTPQGLRFLVGLGVACLYWSAMPVFPWAFIAAPQGIGQSYELPVRAITMTNREQVTWELAVPLRGDQAGDPALPSSPYPRSELMLRSAGDLSKGFRVIDVE